VIKPVKDLFGAVFFVSVGMMIDPNAMVEYAWPILWVTLLTIFGKLFSTTLGALLSGQPIKQSVQVGMSMAQIGEFAFIVATLGLSLGVISDFLFPVAVGASAITTFTTPYFIKYTDPIYDFTVKHLPKKWVARLNNYSVGAQKIQAESHWKLVLKSYTRIVITNGIILLAIALFSINFFVPFINQNVTNETLRTAIVLIMSLGIAAPFLWAFMAKQPNKQTHKQLWLEENYNKGPLLILEIARIVLGILFIAIWVHRLVPAPVALVIIVAITIFVLFIFSRRIQKVYQRMETGFLANLNARETAEAQQNVLATIFRKDSEIRSGLEPWDAHIVEMKVSANAEYIGKTLQEMAWREQFGINIVYIKRGDRVIHVPGRDQRLMPFDQVGIIATDAQVQTFKPVFDSMEPDVNDGSGVDDISLQKIIVDEHTKLKGIDIRSSGLRERTNGIVVGIERNKERILNPESSMKMEWGDVVWIVGDKNKIRHLYHDR
jgi:CPA2 family monovalent cation:H+ antiporter-2